MKKIYKINAAPNAKAVLAASGFLALDVLLRLTPVFAAPDAGGTGAPVSPSSSSSNVSSNPIYKDLNMLINFVSAGVGILVVGTIILGGIQYTMAGDSPDAVSKAKQRITNGLIALAAFLFIYSFIQWLVPGGVF
ncbi:MAG TPA: hypothetical protein VFW52_03240 [Candidatus Saccharimonadales bacterium]|nr:hypothetical protein [Candidatus Saccharimonadales bacterium]